MIVLDTNVVSELIRPHPAARVIDWVVGQEAGRLYLSSISEAELRYGVEILPEGSRQLKLRRAVEGLLREDFGGRILPFESGAARAYAVIAASRRAAGRPISRPDCQIAAIARSVGASVATRDTSGFEGCGVGVINPWSDQREDST